MSLYIALLTMLFFEILRRYSTFFTIVCLLPGTFLHEMSHWIVAFLCRCHPSFPSLIPKRNESGWTLGSVAFEVGWLSAGFVALAPLYLMWGLAYWLLFTIPWSVSTWEYGVLAGVLLNSGLPSRVDWSIAFRYPLGLLLIASGGLTYFF